MEQYFHFNNFLFFHKSFFNYSFLYNYSFILFYKSLAPGPGAYTAPSEFGIYRSKNADKFDAMVNSKRDNLKAVDK